MIARMETAPPASSCSNCPGSARCGRSRTSCASTTSTVSQQIAALAREAGTPLIEPVGRRVRLTPAGRRLADHAVTHPGRGRGGPAGPGPGRRAGRDAAGGRLRDGGAPLAAADRRCAWRRSHPRVRMVIHEHEPAEALDLLAADAIDLALVYDYNLAPLAFDRTLEPTPLWATAVGARGPDRLGSAARGTAPRGLRRLPRARTGSSTPAAPPTRRWCGTIASMAGFEPRVAHRADSLELVQDMIVGRARGRAAARRRCRSCRA